MSNGTMTAGRALLRRLALPTVLLSMTVGAGSLMLAPQAGLASTRAVMALPATGPIVSGYHKNKCIDDLGDSTKRDTPVVIWDCNGTPEQNWTIETDGTIQINGQCLDVYRYRTANKTPVEIWTCHGGSNQQWVAENGTLVNPRSGKCLDDPRFNTTNGTQLEIYKCNGGRNQQWVLP